MGSGAWDTDVYSRTTAHRVHTTGSAFSYSDTATRTTPRDSWAVHPSLNPKDMTVRESRDSADHPNSRPVMICLDVTGSNIRVAREVQKRLPSLNGLLLRKGYIDDPQIMFCAIGDNTSDRIPLQVGQFESDNRMDENLANIFLESNGGSGSHESYENILYVAARKTASDAWDKRGEKGYLFIIGDEMARSKCKKEDIAKLIGDTLQEDIPLEQIFDEVKERYHVFYILPRLSSHGTEPGMLEFWRNYLGQNVLTLDDPDSVSELIALTIGTVEGTTDLDGGVADLRDVGASDRTLAAVSSALKNHPTGALTVTATGSTGLSGLVEAKKKTKRI